MATSIFARKRDLLYLVYFLIHIPIMFLIDLTSLYPESMIPAVSKQLLAFSQENYKDFMLVPAAGMERPAWFVFFMWMEVVFHVPVSFWSLRGLWNDSPKMPLVLLIYGMQTILTTATCIAEYLSWTEITFQEKIDLTMLYGPYLAIAVFMAVDMAGRLNSMIDRGTGRVVGTAPGKKVL